MLTRVDVAIGDAVDLTNSGIDGAEATGVGASPYIKDDSDASYVELDGAYFGPTEPQFLSRAEIQLDPQTLGGFSQPLGSHIALKVDVRAAASHPGLPYPKVTLQLYSAGTFVSAAATPTASTSPTWGTYVMTGDIQSVWDFPNQHFLLLEAAPLSPPPGSGISGMEIRSWQIYEVRLYFEVDLLLPPPPCRLTGRGDSYDLGGGRLYPFAKTQQGGFRPSGTY